MSTCLQKKLANHFKIQEKFERSINSQLAAQFHSYQTHLLQHFPDLPQKLMSLADRAVQQFLRVGSKLPEKLVDIKVVGKVPVSLAKVKKLTFYYSITLKNSLLELV